MRYLKTLRSVADKPQADDLAASVSVKFGYPVTVLRAIESVMFANGRPTAGADEIV